MFLKRWGAWLVMAVIVVVVLVMASGRAGPRTNADRIDAIARTIKCPTCAGESVFVSQAPASDDIKAEIARQVAAGRTDDEVRSYLAERIGSEYLLVPSAGGAGAIVWALPVVVLVLGFGALGLAFGRWRRQLAVPPPDDADRALVAAALAGEHDRRAPDVAVDGDPSDDGPFGAGRIGEGDGR